MALATSCPRCQTSFRVVPDQLKIRRGLVRCGACQHVFSGIDSLRYIDEPSPPSPAPDRAAASAAEISRLIAAETPPSPTLGSPPADSLEPRNRDPSLVPAESPDPMIFDSMAGAAAPVTQAQPAPQAGPPPDAAPVWALEWPDDSVAPAVPERLESMQENVGGPLFETRSESDRPAYPLADSQEPPSDDPDLLCDDPDLLVASPDLLATRPDPLSDNRLDALIEPAHRLSAEEAGDSADAVQHLPGFDPLTFEDTRLADMLDGPATVVATTGESGAAAPEAGAGSPWAANEDWLLDPIAGTADTSQPFERRLDAIGSGSPESPEEQHAGRRSDAPANDTTARGDAAPIWVDASLPPPGDTVIVIDAPADRDGSDADAWPAPETRDATVGETADAAEKLSDLADLPSGSVTALAPSGAAAGLDAAAAIDPSDPAAVLERSDPDLALEKSDSDPSLGPPDSITVSEPSASSDTAGAGAGAGAASVQAAPASTLAGVGALGGIGAAGGLGAVGGIGAVGDPDAVDFFAASSSARGFTSRINAFAMMACVVLSVTLVFQIALAARDWLAAWVPALEPTLSAMSSVAGLRVQAPRSLGALTLESFELQAGNAPGVLNMTALLRNRAAHIVRWPGMELTLTDGSGTVIVRKQLLPADYIGRSLPTAGMPAGLEQNLSVSLEGLELQPTGYNVKLFYP